MTKAYDLLEQGPQTDIHKSDLNPEERAELRMISVRGMQHYGASNPAGEFTTVYYLEGDEHAAAERFVKENRDLLEHIDFSKKDRLQTSLSREIYDLILHVLGERVTSKYDTVVLEGRPDGTQWIITRSKYENNPLRRYATGESGSARIPADISLTELFERFDNIITESDLEETDIEGDVRQVLDYYRVAEDFDCLPTTTDSSQLAIKKSTSTSSNNSS